MLSDLRYALRVIRQQPAFAAVAVLTLALGIGANTTVFSVIRAVLLAPYPYAQPDGLVLIWSKWTGFEKTWLSDQELLDYRRESRSLASIGAWAQTSVNLTGSGSEPERIVAAAVTADLFTALGTRPLLGRTFTSDEDRPGRDDLVVIGFGVWQQRFGGDPGVVGRTVQVDGRPRTVVGVMPAGFMLPLDFKEPEPSQLWLPLGIDPATAERGSHYLYAVGRLAPGETSERAAAELRTITARLVAAGLYPKPMQFEAFAVPLETEVVGEVRPAMWMLLLAVSFLLLIACANVANLLLARADERRREVAVRVAVGAGRAQLVRQFLTESLVLAVLGGAAAILLAWAAVRFLSIWPLTSIPRLASTGLDTTVLVYTALVVIATSIAFGLAPAVAAARGDLVDALKEGAGWATSGVVRRRFRAALVAAQMALAVMLLVSAFLMMRSLRALQAIDPGFRAGGVLTMRLALPEASYGSPTAVVAFYDRLLARLRELEGVGAAGAVRSLPLASTIGDWGLQIEGYVPPPGTNAKGDWQVATPGYLEAMGERLVRGRWFTDGDRTDTPLVAVVNETFARTYWPGQDPIGRRIKQGTNPNRPWITVVGVVGDVRHNGITAVVKEKFYRPHSQFHVGTDVPIRDMTLVIRGADGVMALAPMIRAEVRRLDPNLPVSAVRTMDEIVGATFAAPRFAGWLLALFAALAMALSVVGIYGVLSYVVRQRYRELGVRQALGATPRDVRWLVLKSGAAICAIGLLVGTALGWASTRALESQLYGIVPHDALTFVMAPVVLFSVALLASYVPALRASRVDPVRALRHD